MAALRIGVVGSRFAARLHLLAYRRVYGVEARLAGVVSPTAERREAFARESGATAYPSLAAMLPHVDIVDVCSPPATVMNPDRYSQVRRITTPPSEP